MLTAHLDRTIVDANSGETLTFVETSAESGGERVVMRVALAPKTVVPLHAHPTEEAFECETGTVSFQLDGRPMELRPGARVTVPANHVHGLRVAEEPAVLGVIATPGAEAEYGLRVKFLMSRDGYIPAPGSSGPPKHLLLGAVVIHRGGLYFPPLPRWLFRILMASLAAIGRWRGRERFLRDRYPEYALYLHALGVKAPVDERADIGVSARS